MRLRLAKKIVSTIGTPAEGRYSDGKLGRALDRLLAAVAVAVARLRLGRRAKVIVRGGGGGGAFGDAAVQRR